MPRYEYRCPSNQRLVEVEHTMSEVILTWGELCARAALDPGPTPPEAPVEKVISLSYVSTRSGQKPDGFGGCCRSGGGCGCH